MADAKVIPFDDDRSRAGAVQRPARRRSAGSRRKGPEPALVREVQPLPSAAPAQDDVPVTREEQPPQQAGGARGTAPDRSPVTPPTQSAN